MIEQLLNQIEKLPLDDVKYEIFLEKLLNNISYMNEEQLSRLKKIVFIKMEYDAKNFEDEIEGKIK